MRAARRRLPRRNCSCSPRARCCLRPRVGAPSPDLHIAAEIEGNQFTIAGGKGGVKVSWQVTGVRKDAYAEANRIKVEEDKPRHERGTYLNPTAFKQPEHKGLARTQLRGEK